MTLWGSARAKKSAKVSGSRPCNSFQKPDSGLTPAIRKFFKVSLEVGLTWGTSDFKRLKYSLRISFFYCLILARVFSGGAYVTEALNCPMNNSFICLQELMEFAGSLLNQW